MLNRRPYAGVGGGRIGEVGGLALGLFQGRSVPFAPNPLRTGERECARASAIFYRERFPGQALLLSNGREKMPTSLVGTSSRLVGADP
jgi:hypothetical protein